MAKLFAILGLAATSFAIDAIYNLQTDCGTPSLICTNLPEDVCCSIVDPQAPVQYSVTFYDIPADREIRASVWDGQHCETDAKFPARLWSTDSTLCVPFGENAKSTRWTYSNLKQHDEEAKAGHQDSREPDTLVLEDGSKYNIVGLGKEEIRILVSKSYRHGIRLPPGV